MRENEKYQEWDYNEIINGAENGEPHMMLELAKLYKANTIYDSYYARYIYWLKCFFEVPVVQALTEWLENKEEDDYVVSPDSPMHELGQLEEILLREDIKEAGLALGLYYSRSGKEEELVYARDRLIDALNASAWDYLTFQEVDGSERSVISRIEELITRIDNIGIEEEPMSESLQRLDEVSLDCLIQYVGEDSWENFEPETRTGILTSEISRRFLSQISVDVDYSAAVIPLMKTLEYELARRFYLPYLVFLKEKYDPNSYITTNQLKKPRNRFKIIRYSKKKQEYIFRNEPNKDNETEFTIGNYQYTVGVEDLHCNTCDITAVEFYRERIFKTDFRDDEKITSWICNLARELESLGQLRNNSAHGGDIQTFYDANNAMDALVKVDKILFLVTQPSL